MANEDVAETEYFNIMVKVLKRHFETIGPEKLNDAIAKGLELFLHSKEDESKEVDVMATIDSMMGLSKISRVGDHTCSRCGQPQSFTANRTQLQLENPDRKAKKSKSHAYTVALIFTCSHCGHTEQSIADSTIYVPKRL